MAGRAGNVEALAPAGNHFSRHWKRHVISWSVSYFSRVQISVFVEIATRHCSIDRQAGGTIVVEEIALRQGPVVRLYVHILTASGGEGNKCQQRGQNFSQIERGAHLAWHLRNHARRKAGEKRAGLRHIKLRIARKHDQKEFIV